MAHALSTAAPAVRLELRHGSARPITYDVAGDEFVIGTVPGCDLRLAGANLPPILCVIARSSDGPRLRKLAPALPLLLNGRPVQNAALRAGDTIALGGLSLIVHIDAAATAPQSVSFLPIPPVVDAAASPGSHTPSHDLQEADLVQRRRKLDEQAAELEADRVLWYRRRDELERECREREQLLVDLPHRQAETQAQSAEVAAKQMELDKLREELAEVRRDLFRQYQERRDRLAGLQQAVQTAARKVQDRKQLLDSTEQTTAQLRDELASRMSAVEQREEELQTALRTAEAEQKRRDDLYQGAATAVEARLTECDKREQYLADRDARGQAEWGKIERQRAELEQRERDLAARTVDVTAVRSRDEQLSQLQQQLDADRVALESRDAELAAARAEADRRTADLRQQAEQLAISQREADKLREEQAASQKELHQRYQERRDRLAGLQQAVQLAAGKVQNGKRELAEQEQKVGPRLQELTAAQADLDRRERELAEAREELELTRQATEAEQAGVTARLRSAAEQLETRQAECERREQQIAAQEERHRADLARLDRFQETLEQRERQADATAADADRQRVQLQRDTLEMEEQARQLDAALVTQRAEDERLMAQRLELDAATARLTDRASQVEGQQAMLAALRTRLERTHAEVRQEATLLAEQRVRQEAAERELQEKTRAAEELQARVENDTLAHAAERQHFDGQNSELEAAVARLRELQEKLSAEETALSERRDRLDAQAAEQSTLAAELKGRAAQLLELQEKLSADRQAVKEREAALAREEEARKALQEQLRRRSEDLAARQKQLDEQAREFEARAGQVDEKHEAVGRQKQAADAAVAEARQNLDRQMGEMRQMAERFSAAEANQLRQSDRLKAAGRALAAARKAHVAVKAQWAIDHETAAAEAKRFRAELEEYRLQTAADVETLRQQLPDLELRGQAVLVRLGQAREELRGHLGELHDYARQGQEDLEAVQARVRSEAERLREQEATIGKARAEHRLAVSTFRQQLLEWQGRVADMRRVLADDGTRLERKQAEVSAAAKHVDATAQQLARQAADLQEQERQVTVRRAEMEQHLSDMREWYRRKLRELADSSTPRRRTVADDEPASVPMHAGGEPALPPPNSELRTPNTGEPEILSLTEELDPGDRQLGELLRSLELVDADTLTALLLDARRQRRSLRQVLLSARGGAPLLTLYQLALIESGNLDALVLGPTRVIDRLQATSREAVYRVFDPRRAAEGQGTVLLRHLAEAEMQDAVHPDEFRQRFAALADLTHPNLAATLEVLEINDRPAVLQEWLSGLPAADWPAQAAAPAVWHWLVSQAAAGLHAAHQAGLVHGRITGRSIVLSPAGDVKLTGCGEPPWLAGRTPDATPADDLAAFGEVVTGWAIGTPRRKGVKLPTVLQRILDRLRPNAAGHYPTVAELLVDLEKASSELPAMGDAWEQLRNYAAENATDGVAWRKSA